MLIPGFGMKGTAWATLAAAIAQFLGSLFVIILALRSPVVCGNVNKKCGNISGDETE
jgi:Na+-driven multidrug efflux pump